MSNAAVDPELIKKTITCKECGYKGHSLFEHVKTHDMTPESYRAKHVGAPMLSELASGLHKQMGEMTTAGTPASAVMPKSYDSMATFKIGFGTGGKVTKPISGYVGYSIADGVPLLDQHYQFQSELTRDVLMGMMSGGKIYALGPTGSGKTTLFEQIAARIGRIFYRQQFHGEMESTEIMGNYIVNKDQVFEYSYSGLAMAIQHPSIVCLDEFDSGNPPVTAIANALLEGKPLVLANKGGERIYPHPDCIIVGTGNTNGQGDDSGLYTSTSVQSFATMNRWSMTVVVDYMPHAEEVALAKRVYPKIPAAMIEDMVKVANLVRNAFVDGKITVPLSTRQVIHWGQWCGATGDIKRSFNLAFMNQLTKTDALVVAELFQRVTAAR